MTEHLDASKSEFLALVAASCPPWLKLDAPLRANAPEKVPASTPLVPVSRPNDPVMFGPNITGSFSAVRDNLNQNVGETIKDGAFSTLVPNKNSSLQANGVFGSVTVSIDASQLNEIFGVSGTVQPSSLCALACIKT